MGSGSPREAAGRKRTPRGCVFSSCFPLFTRRFQLITKSYANSRASYSPPRGVLHDWRDVDSESSPWPRILKMGEAFAARAWDQALEDVHLLPGSKLSKILQLHLLSLVLCPGPCFFGT